MEAKKIRPERSHHLDNSLWLSVLKPTEIVSEIGLSGGDWADIGCGTGVFTMPIARLVSSVYALDMSEVMLSRVSDRIRRENVRNVNPMISEESKTPLGDGVLDGVFMAFVVHEFSNPRDNLHEVVRILKPGGRAVIVDFGPQSRVGPPAKELVPEARIDGFASAVGLNKGRTWHWTRRLFGVRVVDVLGLEYSLPTGP